MAAVVVSALMAAVVVSASLVFSAFVLSLLQTTNRQQMITVTTSPYRLKAGSILPAARKLRHLIPAMLQKSWRLQ